MKQVVDNQNLKQVFSKKVFPDGETTWIVEEYQKTQIYVFTKF